MQTYQVVASYKALVSYQIDAESLKDAEELAKRNLTEGVQGSDKAELLEVENLTEGLTEDDISIETSEEI